MYLCNDKHDEICYDQRNCPACELLKKISDQEDKISDLKKEIEKLQEEE